MNVRTLCLAMLSFGESSGYDIRKEVSEGAYRHFVEASFGSIYPALAKLEEDGCVRSRREVQEGRPARKVYALTDKGEREFADALKGPLMPDTFRSPFLLAALCARNMDPADMQAAIDRHVGNLRDDLATIEDAAGRSASPGADWVERFTRETIHTMLGFIEAHRDELVAIADGRDDASALEGTTPFREAAE